MYFTLLSAAEALEEGCLINSTTSLMKSFYANGILGDAFFFFFPLLQGCFDIASALQPRTLKYLSILSRGYQIQEVKVLHYWWTKGLFTSVMPFENCGRLNLAVEMVHILMQTSK